MKQQKLSLIISAVVALISIALYFVGAFCYFYRNDVVKDIFLAIFSSSIFVIGLSIIGYRIEKKRQIKSLLGSTSLCSLESFYTVTDENNNLNRQGLNEILTNLINGLRNIKYLLEEYYYGCFFKDKEVKTLINEKIYSFYQFLEKFYLYNASPQRKKEVLKIQFENNLIPKYQEFSDMFYDWLYKIIGAVSAANKIDDEALAEFEEEAIKNKEVES